MVILFVSNVYNLGFKTKKNVLYVSKNSLIKLKCKNWDCKEKKKLKHKIKNYYNKTKIILDGQYRKHG